MVALVRPRSTTQATFNHPWGLALDAEGGLFIVDAQNSHRVRRMSPGPNGIVTAVVSKEGNGRGFTGERGPAPAAKLDEPLRAAVAPDGSLYVTDLVNHRVRKVSSPLPGFAGVGDIVVASRDGRELYVFTSRGRHLRTGDALVRDDQIPPQPVVLYEFGYDSMTGQLTSITDSNNRTTAISRTQSQVSLTGPHGQVTTITLDGNGYVDQIRNPNDEVTDYDFTDQGLLTQVEDAENHLTTFDYDTNGRLIAALYPQVAPTPNTGDSLARTAVPVPDGSGYQVTHTTGTGVATTYRVEFLPDGRQLRTTLLPDGTVQTREIGIDGAEVITEPTGTEQRVKQGPDPRFGMQAPVGQTTTVTTPDGLESTVTQSRVPSPTTADPFGFTTHTETVTVNGRPVTRTYNATTRTYTDTSPAGRQTTTVLDTHNRPTEQQVGTLTPTTFGYNQTTGQLTGVVQGARSTTITYDPDGNVESVTDSANRTVSFAYDDAGRVTTQTLPDLRTISLAYDSNGNVTSITPPGRPEHTFSYSPTSLPVIYAPPTVPLVTEPRTFYEYNLSGQLSRIDRPGDDDLFLDYDLVTGNLSAQVWPGGQRYFFYDDQQDTGNLDHINFPGGSLIYTYDGSLLKSEQWTGTVAGSVDRTYDNSFRVSTQKVNNANPVTFTYDNDDLLTGAAFGSTNLTLTRSPQTGLLTDTALGVVSDHYDYNTFGEVIGYTASVSGNPNPILAVAYTRDALGRIETKTETIQGGPADTYEYGYDPAGRLTDVTKSNNAVAHYDYDSNGNRTGGFNQLGAFSGTYDNQDRLTAATIGPSSFDYDYTDNGELLSKTNSSQPSDVTTYTYDPLGNLTHVTLPSSTPIDYVIDGRDRRIGKKVNTTLVQGLLFDGQLTPVAELDGSGAVVGRFVYASKANVPDYVIRGTTTYRIISDHLGSPRLVIDPSGTVVQRTDYDEFGNILVDNVAPGFQRLPFGFAGGLYDAQTGLVRFGARDYDPETGRWTAKDLIGFGGGDPNLYGYVLRDPINSFDPSGLFSLTEGVSAVGVVGILAGGANLYLNGTEQEQNCFEEFIDCMAQCYYAPGITTVTVALGPPVEFWAAAKAWGRAASSSLTYPLRSSVVRYWLNISSKSVAGFALGAFAYCEFVECLPQESACAGW